MLLPSTVVPLHTLSASLLLVRFCLAVIKQEYKKNNTSWVGGESHPLSQTSQTPESSRSKVQSDWAVFATGSERVSARSTQTWMGSKCWCDASEQTADSVFVLLGTVLIGCFSTHTFSKKSFHWTGRLINGCFNDQYKAPVCNSTHSDWTWNKRESERVTKNVLYFTFS